MKARTKSIVLATVIAIATLALPFSAQAITGEQKRRFSENDIRFYDPDGGNEINTCGNYNYAGVQVWSDAELELIAANKKFYEAAANKYGFRWEIMAALHSMEHGLARDNPENGQGAYQLYSYTNGGENENAFRPAGSISDEEFARQSDIAASVVKGKIDSNGIDINTDDGVKKLFFAYNGMADKYKEKAKKMGYSDAEANNGEGSSYVMNRYDAKRDPTSDQMSNYWPGRYVSDGNYDENSTSTVFGAFVKYKALATECTGGGDQGGGDSGGGGGGNGSGTGGTAPVTQGWGNGKNCPGNWQGKAKDGTIYDFAFNKNEYATYTAEVGSKRTYCNYKQRNTAWVDLPANGSNEGTMGSRGCFATSTAIIMSGYASNVNDSSPAKMSYSSGGFDFNKVETVGMVQTGDKFSSAKEMAKILKEDKAIVLDEYGAKKGCKALGDYWTTSQHKIAVVDVDSSEEWFFVLNPSDTSPEQGANKSGWKSYYDLTVCMKDYWVAGLKSN
ncbi:hypothetical protein IKH83_03100 [Candidatus Saccharibacteria bacterium]|nr:hypothetical protein [Candidatus Saccharibacteria bacterium]